MTIFPKDFGTEQTPPQPTCPQLANHLPDDHPYRLFFTNRGAVYDACGRYVVGSLAGDTLPENFDLNNFDPNENHD